MLADQPLQPIKGHAWHRGLSTVLAKENRKWWAGYRWLLQAAIWLVVINGMLVMVLFVMPNMAELQGQSGLPDDLLLAGTDGFFTIAATALALGIIVLAQDSIIGEKQSGTAEWLLSKPVSRTAFVLAKLMAHALGVLVIYIGLQGAVAYVQLSQVGDMEAGPFLLGLGILSLHTTFYLALTILMGVLVNSRGLALAVPLGLLLGGQLLLSTVSFEPLLYFTPLALSKVATLVALQKPVPTELYTPVGVTAVWIVLMVGAAVWRFNRHEF